MLHLFQLGATINSYGLSCKIKLIFHKEFDHQYLVLFYRTTTCYRTMQLLPPTHLKVEKTTPVNEYFKASKVNGINGQVLERVRNMRVN